MKYSTPRVNSHVNYGLRLIMYVSIGSSILINVSSWAWWHTPVIPAVQGTEIGGLCFEASPSSRLMRPHLNKQAGYHGHACNPSYARSTDRISIWGQTWANMWDFIWKITKVKKDWKHDSSSWAPAYSSSWTRARPWVQTPVLPKDTLIDDRWWMIDDR
jgi:hypothetical protein